MSCTAPVLKSVTAPDAGHAQIGWCAHVQTALACGEARLMHRCFARRRHLLSASAPENQRWKTVAQSDVRYGCHCGISTHRWRTIMITSAGSLPAVNTVTTTSAGAASAESPKNGMATDVSHVRQTASHAAPRSTDWGWSESGIRQGIDPETGDYHDGTGNIQPGGIYAFARDVDAKQLKRDAVASNFASAGQSGFGVYGTGRIENLTFTSDGVGRTSGTDASSTVPSNVTLSVSGPVSLTLTLSSQPVPAATTGAQAYEATIDTKRCGPSKPVRFRASPPDDCPPILTKDWSVKPVKPHDGTPVDAKTGEKAPDPKSGAEVSESEVSRL